MYLQKNVAISDTIGISWVFKSSRQILELYID